MRPLLRRARSAINTILEPYDQHIVHGSQLATPRYFFEILRANRLTPRTVFDIGVATGTPWLYEAFPGAKLYLVDPTSESLPHMQRWAERLDATVLNVALGAEERTAEIHVYENIEQASLLEEAAAFPIVATYEVPVRRFDDVIDGFERPALCKIDAQGAEIDVLRGMGDRLEEMDAFLIEASLLAPYADGPDFYEVARLMHEHGYALHDVTGFYRRALDGALAQIDAAFVPRSSPLRQDRRWG